MWVWDATNSLRFLCSLCSSPIWGSPLQGLPCALGAALTLWREGSQGFHRHEAQHQYHQHQHLGGEGEGKGSPSWT